MTEVFIKHGSPSQIKWEATGLAWLNQAQGAQVVEVFSSSNTQLVEQKLIATKASVQDAEAFGQALAITHDSLVTGFGVGPDGWDDSIPGWIGKTRLALGNYRQWGKFYAELRILPHAKRALTKGNLSPTGMKVIEKVCSRLMDGHFDDGRPPCRIHGDLWAGNVICTQSGFTLIDPAAHGGHGETDLAMLALFGFPHLRIVLDSYAQAARLPSDWQDRIGLHQLHPLLVHAELFGGGYGFEAVQIAKKYV